MYCTTCQCEFNGWTGKCPVCRQPLQEGIPLQPISQAGRMNYESLVEVIEHEHPALVIPVAASQVERKRSRRFPWLGFGFAWTQKMGGTSNGILVEMQTTEVGKDRKWAFPYQGHGYAWEQEMQGRIGGNEFTLLATKENRQRTFTFPYAGHGYAWTEEMSGDCGNRIRVKFHPSKIIKKRSRRFPYFGYGFAWVQEAQLTLNLV